MSVLSQAGTLGEQHPSQNERGKVKRHSPLRSLANHAQHKVVLARRARYSNTVHLVPLACQPHQSENCSPVEVISEVLLFCHCGRKCLIIINQ
jgi:hypothetical protein